MQFGRNRTDNKRLKVQLEKNGANIANTQSWLIELEVNDVVIRIHLVTQTGDLDQLPIQFQDVPHFTQTARVNLKFEHGAVNLSGPVKWGTSWNWIGSWSR